MNDTHTEQHAMRAVWSRRNAVIGVVALLVVSFVGWSFRPQPVLVDFAVVTRGDLDVTLDDEGETRIKSVYVVSAPVAGRVERIELEVGDPVIAGETVLALFQPQDPALLDARSRSEAEAGVGLAEAERDRAAAELEFARLELRRATQLRKEGTVSEVTLNKAELAVKTAKAAVDQAAATVARRRADFQSARAAMASAGSPTGPGVKVSYIPVRAPVSGRVLKRMQQSEALLPAGTPLLEIGNPADLEIVTDLLSADAVKVSEGNEVIVEEWGGPLPLKGQVKRVEPFGFTKVSALGVEEQRVNVIMDFTSPYETWKSLGHGYRVMTRIVISHRPNVLNVPLGALFRAGKDWALFVDDNGRARLTHVTVGERNALYAEIKDGLTEGQRIIVHPNDQVADGVRVRARHPN